MLFSFFQVSVDHLRDAWVPFRVLSEEEAKQKKALEAELRAQQ